jgi:hypothetical protein
MKFQWNSEEQRLEAVRRHAEIIRRGFAGEITTVEMLRLSKELQRPYRKPRVKANNDAFCAPDEHD